MGAVGSPIDAGFLLQSLTAYGDSTPAPVQAKVVNQPAINTNKRIGRLALFYEDGSPYVIPTNVASLPAATSPAATTTKLLSLQGGAAVLLTTDNLFANAPQITSVGNTNGFIARGTNVNAGELTFGATLYGPFITIKTVSTDANNSTQIGAKYIQFGPGGGGALDTKIERTAAATLTVTGIMNSSGASNGFGTTGTGAAWGSGSLAATSFGTFLGIRGNSGDAQPTTLMGSQFLSFGPGGSTGVDWSLRRVAAGQANVEGHLGILDAKNIYFGSTTGTKIGGYTTEKFGFWGATPVTRPGGWTAATGTPTRGTFATSTVTLPQLAEHFKALVDDLITIGLIGS